MRLVPSGTVRFMKTQQFAVPQDGEPGVDKTTYVDDQNGANASGDGSSAIDNLKRNLSNPQSKPQVDVQNIDNVVDEKSKSLSSNKSGLRKELFENQINFQKEYLQAMSGIGLDQAAQQAHSDRIIKVTPNLAKGGLEGYIQIPKFTEQGQITPEQAYDIMDKLAQKYKLDYTANIKGYFYIFDFEPLVSQDIRPATNAFDAAYGHGKGQENGSRKAAQTNMEMTKESRDRFFDHLSKVGDGDNK